MTPIQGPQEERSKFNKLIVLISNDKSQIDYYETILKYEGFHFIRTFDDSKLALGSILSENNCPDLIIMKINMPEIDGYKFFNNVRRKCKERRDNTDKCKQCPFYKKRKCECRRCFIIFISNFSSHYGIKEIEKLDEFSVIINSSISKDDLSKEILRCLEP